jgi:hypothetical protein
MGQVESGIGFVSPPLYYLLLQTLMNYTINFYT